MTHEPLVSDDRRDCHPAADALADGHQVRDDAPVLGGPESSGPPEPRLDLVEDEDDAVTVAQRRAGPARNPAGGMTTPPLPWTGSTTMAATARSRTLVFEGMTHERERLVAGLASAGPSGQRYGYGIGQEVGVRVATDRRPERRLAVEPDDAARPRPK